MTLQTIKALDGRVLLLMPGQIQQLLVWLTDFTAKTDARLLNRSHLSLLWDVGRTLHELSAMLVHKTHRIYK